MGRRRAILTDDERQQLQKTDKDNRYYQAVSRIRKKVNNELPNDVEILREHHPDLLEELQDVVCAEE